MTETFDWKTDERPKTTLLQVYDGEISAICNLIGTLGICGDRIGINAQEIGMLATHLLESLKERIEIQDALMADVCDALYDTRPLRESPADHHEAP